LEFFERTPPDPRRPLERFKVRLTGLDLEAIVRVYAEGGDPHPAPLFAQMAAHWRGWQGQFAWDAAHGGLALRGEQDRAGHVALRVELRCGPSDDDWSVRATVMAEAGQLEDLARRSAAFFGCPA
jgi:hypothetical protein